MSSPRDIKASVNRSRIPFWRDAKGTAARGRSGRSSFGTILSEGFCVVDGSFFTISGNSSSRRDELSEFGIFLGSSSSLSMLSNGWRGSSIGGDRAGGGVTSPFCTVLYVIVLFRGPSASGFASGFAFGFPFRFASGITVLFLARVLLISSMVLPLLVLLLSHNCSDTILFRELC